MSNAPRVQAQPMTHAVCGHRTSCNLRAIPAVIVVRMRCARHTFIYRDRHVHMGLSSCQRLAGARGRASCLCHCLSLRGQRAVNPSSVVE